MMKEIIAFAIVAATLIGCSGGPGAPLVRTSSADGEDFLIPDCENISNADKTSDFITNSYLTTWASAYREGGAAGYYEGMKEGLKNTEIMIEDARLKEFAYGQLPKSVIFCKAYPTNANHAFQVASALLPQLGYKLVVASQIDGLISTEYVDGAHIFPGAKLPFVKWKDMYRVKIEWVGDAGAVVKVFRDVYISRCSAKTGECSDYLRATSVGHNEAVILNQIDRELRGS